MKTIGKNIRQLRIARNMTQEGLAEALFVTRQTVSNYETEKSRPDIDTLMEIARVLDADIQVLLYGLPVPEEKKTARIRAIVAGSLLAVLAIAYGLLLPVCREYAQLYYRTVPLLLLHLTIRPALLFIAGWLGIHGLGMALKLRPAQNRVTGILRMILLVILSAVVILPIPYILWLFWGLYQSLTAHNVSLIFPNIPLYTSLVNGLLWLQLECPFFMTLLGVLCPLLGIPGQRNAK